VGRHDDLLSIKLDVTRPEDARAAVEAAVKKFGRIDVLVNNAGNFYAGFFEELSPEQVRNQIETLLFGPMNVTRAVLPVMRKQRSGLLLTISSTAGIAGGMFCTAYAAAKFGIEGWMESLAPEIAPFGIRTMLVEPGFFRTELLTRDSTTFAKPSIDDYAERTRETVAAWSGMDGKQGGDPAKLANALVQLGGLKEPPSASPPARTPYRRSRPRPTPCSHRQGPTPTCPPRSLITTPDHTGPPTVKIPLSWVAPILPGQSPRGARFPMPARFDGQGATGYRAHGAWSLTPRAFPMPAATVRDGEILGCRRASQLADGWQ
jgi:NAD(P)-dependent dehydrogenase (short-subunit alcohol dehydrogenase family)